MRKNNTNKNHHLNWNVNNIPIFMGKILEIIFWCQKFPAAQLNVEICLIQTLAQDF
jgi:hypothetical protein